jgi:UDP-glucose-4-epimerase GalE
VAVILVTGGAGYIGAHVCKALSQAGHMPVTFDNFSTGRREAVLYGPLEEGDLRSVNDLRRAFANTRPAAVVHLAALSNVAESMVSAKLYAEVNIAGTTNLIAAMQDCALDRLVFSSTCAVYADRGADLLREDSPLGPVSVYGQTKVSAEEAIAISGLKAVTLRFFNAAGADGSADIGEMHSPETHLIPLALRAAAEGGEVRIFGQDYPTPDGTCVRDYVHVSDLAAAHAAALERLLQGGPSLTVNLGSGSGYSVRDVLRSVEGVTGNHVRRRDGPVRAGDAPRLVADAALARRELGWRAASSALAQMVGDAWAWHRVRGFDF